MQLGLLDSDEEKQRKIKAFDDNQLTFLPVAPLQEKFAQAEPELTSCEYEVMHMLLSGYSIQDMGLKIFLSPAGIKYRLTNIYKKFGVENRLGIIRKTSTKGIQFTTKEYDKKSGEYFVTKYSFHNHVNLRAHSKGLNDEHKAIEAGSKEPEKNL